MKNESFVKKLKKRIPGIEVIEDDHRWSATHNGTLLTWRTQPRWDNKEIIEAAGFHTQGVDQESDPYTDYYPGTFWDNGTQAIDRLCPPPNKFKAGQLVIGKQNKRAHRYGYAGKTALVTKAPSGDQVVLQFVGADAIEYKSYNDYYYTRDFDLVSG
tara:strand:- start:2707 stop:3177 length:471 start_codon:yes stop_codon:yes gene_type:complete